jgi:predicted porin
MKRIQFLIAVTGLTTPLVSGADTTIFGTLNANYGFLKDNGKSVDKVRMTGSRLGVKGFTPLSEGWEGTYILEAGVDLKDNDEVKADTRQAWLGLRGNLGELRLGRQFGATKVSSAPVDLFSDQFADYNTILESEFTYNQSLAYINKIGPLGFAIELSKDKKFSKADTQITATDAVVNYSKNGVYAAFATMQGKDTLKMSRLTGAYTFFEGHKIGATFEQTRPETGAGYDAFLVSGGYQAGDSFLKAQYGVNKPKGEGEKETLAAVGWDYRVAKKTVVSLEYSVNKHRDHLKNDELKTTAIGLSHGF